MKRQRGRNRGGGGGGGGGKPQHNANRAFDSNGPDNVKIRGHAQHVFEKYQQLARDAFSSGDRMLAENYLQHADHYFRVLRTIQPQRPPSEILGRDVLASGLDIDFEEEFEPADEPAAMDGGTEVADAAEGGREPRFQREDRPERQDVRRDGYDYREPRRDDRYEGRRDEAQLRDRAGEGRRDNEPQFRDRGEGYRDRGDRFERGDRPDRFEGRRDNRRFEGRREERPINREGREQRHEERRAVEPGSAEVASVDPNVTAEQIALPALASEPSAVLRSQDGGSSEAPAFLQAGGGGEEGEGRRPRPRRRRAPRSFEAGEGGEARGPAESMAQSEKACSLAEPASAELQAGPKVLVEQRAAGGGAREKPVASPQAAARSFWRSRW